MERVKVGQLWGEKTGINSNDADWRKHSHVIVFDLFLVFFLDENQYYKVRITCSKNPVRNRLKIQFVELDFPNWLFRNQVQINRGKFLNCYFYGCFPNHLLLVVAAKCGQNKTMTKGHKKMFYWWQQTKSCQLKWDPVKAFSSLQRHILCLM